MGTKWQNLKLNNNRNMYYACSKQKHKAGYHVSGMSNWEPHGHMCVMRATHNSCAYYN